VAIKRNAIYNLAGGTLPALVSLVVVPLMVRGLGSEGYGLYALVLAIVGYFALIDINATAGSVKFLAEYSAAKNSDGINQVFSLGFLIYLCIGLLGACAIYALSSHLVVHVFSIDRNLTVLAQRCLEVAAIGFFFGQLQVYLQSVPQALLRYDITGRIEMLFGSLLPLLAVVLLAAGYGLLEIIALRVAASAVNCLLLWRSIRSLLPTLRMVRPRAALAGQLFRFSAYSFLGRAATLTYQHADKLLIGSLVGMKALAYYTVAANLANGLLGMTYRLASVVFPSTSMLAAKGQFDALRQLYFTASRYMLYLNGALLLLLAVFAKDLLLLWVGPDFAEHGSTILALIALAQFFSSQTNVPSLLNDGLGHPQVTGGFAVTRAVVGLVAVYLLASIHGAQGAALAHMLVSCLVTVVFLLYVHGRTVPYRLSEVMTHAYAVPIGVLTGVAAVTYGASHMVGERPPLLAATAAVGALLLVVLGVCLVAMPAEKQTLRSQWRALLARLRGA